MWYSMHSEIKCTYFSGIEVYSDCVHTTHDLMRILVKTVRCSNDTHMFKGGLCTW